MKVTLVFLAACICAVAAQSDFFTIRSHKSSKQNAPSSSSSSRIDSIRKSFERSRSSRSRTQSTKKNDAVDATLKNSEYHFSWLHAGRNKKWTFSGANRYCSRTLSGGWKGISINDKAENDLVKDAIRRGKVDYTWTGGERSSSRSPFTWPEGPFSFTDWSHTGFLKKPQPDNRDGDEHCLSVLNSFYNDGIKWHDVGCHHKKPMICERPKKS